ncbi:MAG: hypothetical protein HYX26_00800 [Acidobacteriales bacterium]|nr:hypothetical protein [Terriglobales bacterium]
MRLQYATSRTYFYGPFTGGISQDPIPPGERILPAFDEVHTGTLQLSYQRPWRDLYSNVNIRGGSGTAALDGALRLPSHVTADLTARVSLWKQDDRTLSAEFNVENVSGDRYPIAKESEVAPIQYSPGRVIGGRSRFRF